jgi:hypothetical protein
MSTEPYPLHCAECGERIPAHEDHCEHCHPARDETLWPTRALIGLCALYFFVVLTHSIFS